MMNNLQYSMIEFSEVLRKIINQLDARIYHELNDTEKADCSHLIQNHQRLADLTELIHDLILVISQTSEVTYYVNWRISIGHKQIPEIQLSIHPISENDYYPFTLSTTLNHYLLKQLLRTHIIPNPWEIS